MPRYHAVMLDECGSEFPAEVDEPTHDAAWSELMAQ